MNQTAKVRGALVALAIGIGVPAIPGVSMADDPPADVASAGVVTATANIQKINKDSRMVSLKGPEGNVLEIKVGPNVNLDKLKVGDKVNAAYYEEVAVGLHKSGEHASKTSQTVTEHGGIAAKQTTVTAKVVSVDTAMNTVALRGPAGAVHVIKVQDPDLQAQLGKIKPGDNVDVTYTQAVAVSVEPMK